MIVFGGIQFQTIPWHRAVQISTEYTEYKVLQAHLGILQIGSLEEKWASPHLALTLAVQDQPLGSIGQARLPNLGCIPIIPVRMRGSITCM